MIDISFLYVLEDHAKIQVIDNYMTVTKKNEEKTKVPIETLESIGIFGNAQMTTQCIRTCLERGIPVAYYSKGGKYFGRLVSTGHVHVERQRKQDRLYSSDFALTLSKRLISAKIHNQMTVLRRYGRSRNVDVEDSCRQMHMMENKIDSSGSVSQLMGYEGICARQYFKTLGKLVEPDFAFPGRSKQPPRDAFNSMLSLGYSVLMNEIYGKIENRGLNPYFGFLHRDRERHPTLASDLMEEWRAAVVDTTIMSIVNGHEIKKEHFYEDCENPGIFLTREGMKILLTKLEKKMEASNRYLKYTSYPTSFRRAMEMQVDMLIQAMNQEQAEIYSPVRIR